MLGLLKGCIIVVVSLVFLGCGTRFVMPSEITSIEELQKHTKNKEDMQEALVSAAMYGKIDQAKYLLEHGADVNYIPGDFMMTYGYPALHAAVVNNHLEMVKFLIAQGADVNKRQKHGGGNDNSAAMRAFEAKHLEILRYLVSQGADLYSFETTLKHMSGGPLITLVKKEGYHDLANELLELQKSRTQTVQKESEKEKVTQLIEEEKFEDLKVYTDSNPNAVYYIPQPELRLMFTGPKGLKVGDIAKMVERKRSEKIIIAMIRGVKTPYKEFSIDEIEILVEMGLSDDIIVAMVEVSTELFKDAKRKAEQEHYLKEQAKIAKESQKTQVIYQGGVQQSSQGGVMDEVTQEVTKQGVKMLLDHLF
ncbi:MAG: ankyrin repeat domain-containing protein [Helicobacteraceae bacterium]|nr:ankyrin repeat domain-containing protein [Helicobacteraceae bacterium]